MLGYARNQGPAIPVDSRAALTQPTHCAQCNDVTCHDDVQLENPRRRCVPCRLAHPATALLGRPHGPPRRGGYVVLRLELESGIVGWGEAQVIGTWGGDHGARYGETPN